MAKKKAKAPSVSLTIQGPEALGELALVILKGQAETLEFLIDRDGRSPEDIRALAAIYTVIEYNSRGANWANEVVAMEAGPDA